MRVGAFIKTRWRSVALCFMRLQAPRIKYCQLSWGWRKPEICCFSFSASFLSHLLFCHSSLGKRSCCRPNANSPSLYQNFYFVPRELKWELLLHFLGMKWHQTCWITFTEQELVLRALFLSKMISCLRPFKACFSFFPITCLLFCFKHMDYANPSSLGTQAIGIANKSDSVAVNSAFFCFNLFNLIKLIPIAYRGHDSFHQICFTEAAVQIVRAALRRLNGDAV